MMRRIAKKVVFVTVALAMLLSVAACGVFPSADGSKGGLYINEVVSSNAFSLSHPTIGSPDWIEIYNAGSAPVDLTGYGLTDNIKDPHKWTFPTVTIPAGGYVVVYATKYSGAGSEMCTGFGISKSGETLYLTDPFYEMLQQLQVPELASDVSYARNSEGVYGYCSSPTPNSANDDGAIFGTAEGIVASGSDGAPVLTEVMPKNDGSLPCADGTLCAWAEIYNPTDTALLLSDFYLSDTVATTAKWRFPTATLEPKAYAIVFLSGDETDGGEMHASFRLGKADSTLILSDGAGNTLSMLNWSTSIPEGVCVVGGGEYSASPTPGAQNAGATFASMDFSPMSSASPVRINEVLKLNEYSLRDAYGDRSPWVELYNSSAEAVSLYGCYLSDDLEAPFKWGFPDGAQIDAGGYIVVFLSGSDSTDSEYHASFSLSRRENEVVFTNTADMTRDVMSLDPAIGENVSAGLNEAGEVRYYTAPTPGAANATHAYDAVPAAASVDMEGVYISEVCATNAAKSGNPDWIELHNASGRSVDLSGWHLTDDTDELTKYTISSLDIASGGYAALTELKNSEGVSTPFSISAAGETLLLTDRDGEIRDVFKTGALRANVTSGRVAGNEARVFFASTTKGEANAEPSAGFVSAPAISDCSLYHEGTLSVSISCPTPNAQIRYTTDGSKPTAASELYAGPLTFTANAVLRAVATAEGMLPSDTVSATYLFEEPHTLPVISLMADQADFSELYAVIDRWKKIEREGYFSYYEPDGLLGTEFPCGLRVSGASTLTMRQKSLAVFLRGGYGQSSSSFQFFPGNVVSSYRSLSLRNSGQDASKARLRDSFFMKAVKGLNIERVETHSVVVYVNGEYRGLYDLNENQNEDYMASHYGVDADAVDIVRRNETPLAGDRYDFKRVRAFALNTDTSTEENYAKLCEWVDVDYFMDYLIAQTYFSNGDMFNQKYWRSQDYTVKWRPLYFDLDYALSASSPTRNILPSYFNAEGVPSQDQSLTNMDIYVGLRKNKGWCEKFGERYVYVVKNFFTADRLTAILDEMQAQMEPEMERHIKRWGMPSSVAAWKSSVKSLRDCLGERESYALSALQREFGFTDAQMQQWTAAATAAAPLPTAEGTAAQEE